MATILPPPTVGRQVLLAKNLYIWSNFRVEQDQCVLLMSATILVCNGVLLWCKYCNCIPWPGLQVEALFWELPLPLHSDMLLCKSFHLQLLRDDDPRAMEAHMLLAGCWSVPWHGSTIRTIDTVVISSPFHIQFPHIYAAQSSYLMVSKASSKQKDSH